VLVPDAEAIGRILDMGEVDLSLQRTLQRRTCRFERRLQLFKNQKFGLPADLGTGPRGTLRDMCPRVEPVPALCAIWPATKIKSLQMTAGTKPEIGAEAFD
jgi:hypothetical protein